MKKNLLSNEYTYLIITLLGMYGNKDIFGLFINGKQFVLSIWNYIAFSLPIE